MIVHLRFKVLNQESKVLMGDRIVARGPLRHEKGRSENYLYYSGNDDTSIEVVKEVRQAQEVICEIASSKVILVLEDALGEPSEIVLSRDEMDAVVRAYQKAKRARSKEAGFVKHGE